ncbi:bifunctional adenosylcobinamide kinase/adenosylcobinamide-phosphate guanylyltransferase [Candidatus Raskinella chloraquaticus]|uniref:bifunctional adenosylcobinamide kinase/adenosylcobinamide-phosphate guanylyltransferase n=1 Tax=Candidatus Raskinella chloraquaticus TaxID=1951219 RepID=UPI0036716324
MPEQVAASLAPVTLLLGGARSGKTGYGLRLAEQSGFSPVYVATGWAGDDEMADRIARHRAERGGQWTTIEERLDLVAVLARQASPERVLLVDCLTLWLANLMGVNSDPDIETLRLAGALNSLTGPIILIANEVGLGLVPETPVGRRFRDMQGRLNQAMARSAQSVMFLAAGLPLILKSPESALP